MPSGIDQSWGFADPKAAKAAGVQVVSMYVSRDSSKNATAAKIKAYHKVGIGDQLNWEQIAGAPLMGAGQGTADATEAVRQVRALISAVGYAPRNRLTIYFSCDTDVTAAQVPGSIAAYYRAARSVCHAAGFGIGCYGEATLVHYLAAEKITDAEWQTLAWSGGVLDPATDFYQSSINNSLGGASVDFDQVIHAPQLGAWWPPGHPLDTAGEDDMALDPKERAALIADIVDEVWAHKRKAADGAEYSMEVHVASGRVNAAAAAAGIEAVASALAADNTGVIASVAAARASLASVAKAIAALSTTVQAQDVTALATAIAKHLPATDVAALAAALAPKIPKPDETALAKALAPHLSITTTIAPK